MPPKPKITWPVSFKGRHHSGAYNLNFLWKCGRIYVMDNHRAALWCWLQELDLTSKHSLFHIDRHTDCLQSRMEEWLPHLPSWSAGIEEYLDKGYLTNLGEHKTIRWDNYLSIYFHEFGDNLDKCFFATREGDKPNYRNVINAALWNMPSNMDYWLHTSASPWIVNIDLDYFFWNCEENTDVMVSETYLNRTFLPLRAALEQGEIAVITICLTPDPPFTGGWEAAELLANRLLNILGLDFKLPD